MDRIEKAMRLRDTFEKKFPGIPVDIVRPRAATTKKLAYILSITPRPEQIKLLTNAQFQKIF